MRKLWKAAAAGILSVFMIGTTVLAAPSVTKNGAVSQDFTIDGVAVEGAKAEFTSDFSKLDLKPEVAQVLETLKSSPEKLQEVLTDVKLPENDTFDVKAAKLLTEPQDLSILGPDGEIIKDAKNVTITWEVPNLTEGLGEVRVLHYSTVRDVWEVLKPEDVNFADKSITQLFPDLSPVAVIYTDKDGDSAKAETAGTDASAEKAPKTGDNSPVLFYAVLAGGALLLIAGSKKRKA